MIKRFFFKELQELKKLKEENKKLKIELKKAKILNTHKDEIISAISHEFKNPISIINGYIETILTSNLDEKTKEKFLKKIYKNTTRLSELIDRLYFSTKLQNNKISLKKTNFRLDITAKNVVERFEDRIEIISTPITINADKDLFEIVLQNLLSNALKYSKDKVILKIDNQVEVIDSGVGIDKKDIELIKEKFYRVAKNDWDNSLGLGLAIVEKILKMHNCSLMIESQKGKGSKFYFDISHLKQH